MVIPFIASVMRGRVQVVPAMLKESPTRSARPLGSGLERGPAVPKIGVVGGILLGLGRALGETMP